MNQHLHCNARSVVTRSARHAFDPFRGGASVSQCANADKGTRRQGDKEAGEKAEGTRQKHGTDRGRRIGRMLRCVESGLLSE